MQEPLGYKHLQCTPNQLSMQSRCPWKGLAIMDRQVAPCTVHILEATGLEACLPPQHCTVRGVVDLTKALVNVNSNGDWTIPR